jgi:hypothetical protein
MKIFNLVFALIFLVFAGLQYNDPDPYVWMPIYLYGTVLCWFAFRGRYYPTAMIVGIALYALYGLYLFFTNNGVMDWFSKHHAENIAHEMKAATPWIEDTREFFGLCIVSFVFVVDILYARRRKVA